MAWIKTAACTVILEVCVQEEEGREVKLIQHHQHHYQNCLHHPVHPDTASCLWLLVCWAPQLSSFAPNLLVVHP